MDAAITAETFVPHVGKAASLSNGHEFMLVTVDVHTSPEASSRRQSGFTLILRGPRAPVAPEGMHRLTFESGASFELYVIPIHTPSRDHQDYQIVFN
jgi:hypothetical protein